MIKYLWSTIFSFSILYFTKVNIALAQVADDLGVNDLSNTNLGTRELTDTIAMLINVFLGLLGTIAVVLIIYGGWMWMTSQGNAEKVQKAKMILTSAIIGLVIILASYAIARFVLQNIYDATGGEGGVVEPPPPPPPPWVMCDTPDDPDTVEVCQITPDDTGGPIGQYILIEGWNFDVYGGNSQIKFNGTDDVIAELVSCGGAVRWNELYTSGGHTYYRVKAVIPNVTLDQYKVEVHTDDGAVGEYPADPLYFEVRAGDPGPGIACISPDAQFRDFTVDIEGTNLGDFPGSITISGWDDIHETIIDINFTDWSDWSDSFISNARIPLDALSSDLFITAGGLDSAPEYLQVLCTVGDLDCASGCCTANSCREAGICLEYALITDGPFIDRLSPDWGAEGNLVTVYGSGFGDLPGRVLFEDNAGDKIEGVLDVDVLNPACSSLWTDNAILVVVPDNVKDINARVWVEHADGEESNFKYYDDSIGPLPGLCQITPAIGEFGEVIVLDGIKFSIGDKASFGGVLDHDTEFLSAFKMQAKVPNILPGETGVWLHTDGDKDGNALPFTVSSVSSGDPVIHEVSPTTGPKGQYLTVYGANFGNVQGQLNFILGLDEFSGNFDFPPQCSDAYWQDTNIVVKVPNIIADDYKIQVKRNIDGKASNQYDFAVGLGTPGPGFCAMIPDNGPANDVFPVNLYGDNFGTVPDKVNFFNSILATINSWADDHINVHVPNGAVTGPVTVERGADISNSLNFSVASCSSDDDCSLGDECCSQDVGNYCAPIGSCPGSTSCEYKWTITTEAEPFGLRQNHQCEDNLQSPSPWPDDLDGEESRDAYLDTNIIGLFTRDVEDVDFNADNIQVSACNIGGEFIDATCAGSLSGSIDIINHGSDSEGFIFNPDNDLNFNTWYKVSLGTFHSEIGNDVWSGAGFPWHFRTQNALCEVANIQVTPANSPQADIYVGHTRDFYASPEADNCNICGGNYNWSLWTLPDLDFDDSINAEIISQDIAGVNISQARLEGLQVTENDPDNPIVELQATLPVVADVLNSTAEFKIKDAILSVVDRGPNCNESCINAAVWARFNTMIDSDTLSNALNIEINECNDSTCTSFTGSSLTDHLSLLDEYTVNIHHDDFVANTYYKVEIRANGIENIAGYALGSDYTWTFQTADSRCLADRAVVNPTNYLSTAWNEFINYTVTPYSEPNSCSATGQELEAEDYGWDWEIDDPSVASLSEGGTYEAEAETLTNGTTFIQAEIDTPPADDPASLGLLGTATLIVNQAPDIFYAAPKILSHAPTTPACLNSAMVVQFDSAMNNTSLANNIKLYQKSSSDLGDCLFVAGEIAVLSPWQKIRNIFLSSANAQAPPDYYWCPVSGYYSLSELAVGTKFIFYPDEALLTDHEYLGSVWPDAASIVGELLDPSEINFDYDNNGADDFYGWEFTTNDQMCQVSFVTVDPSPDLFTCSRSNCPGDVNGTLPGNQHQYTATAYDPAGTVLNMSEYNWFEHNDLLNLESDIGVSIQATAANNNGTTSLIVEASDPLAGSAIGQSYINLFLCENPWPKNPAEFPYDFNFSAYNFSTYYCQDSGSGQGAILPYLSDPITPMPSGMILEEFIFIVDPAITAITNRSLAEQQSESWWYRFIDKFKKRAFASIPTPTAPTGLAMVDNSGDGVTLHWQDNAANEDGFHIYRKSSEVDWMQIAELDSAASNPVEFIDTSIIANEVYSYRVTAFNDGGNSDYSDTVTVVAAASAIDVIGVRVMRNAEHLSINDWYQTYAPNPEITGQLFETDGYQAMQVGNTVYISAANVDVAGAEIYTNIYIISHNIGARESTREIFERMLANMDFSINIDSVNVCHADATRSCQNMFDCADLVPATCDADGLQLRRDTKRLNDLIEIKGLLDSYGQAYKACNNNSNISCINDDQCPDGGLCVPYYPLLNSGTYINGMSVTRWPSWQEEFSQTLSTPALPQDPVNRFAGCPDGFDSDTCWDDLNSDFYCPEGSLIYLYKKEVAVNDYSLDANFEFNFGGIDFASNLISSVDNKIQFDHGDYCDDISTFGGVVDSPHCGNGIVEFMEGESCDGNFRNLCDTMLFEANWWNEHLGGCYPPSTLDPDTGELIECTWYEPEPALSTTQCGNFCGDGNINSVYESCDSDDFGGIDYGCPLGEDLLCHSSLCYPTCDGGSTPTICGDGIWDEASGEQCDNSANPNGLEGWSCSEGGTLSCNSCVADCTAGDPYEGACDDGSIDDPPEECEPISHTQPAPVESSAIWQYACGMADTPQACLFQGGWCGDGSTQDSYNEECDWYNYVTPDPVDSDSNNQYACSNICLFEGGWCGDDSVEIAYESCDGGDVACNTIDPIYTAGWAECGTPAEPNACQVVDTAACCTTNNLRAKFLADNDFYLYVNSVDPVEEGHSWPACNTGGSDNDGACEFNIAIDGSIDNVIAFWAHDDGSSQGVVGTFSCQAMTCQSICYKGGNAGNYCSNNSDCPNGACIHPGVAEGTSCNINQDCGFDTRFYGDAVLPSDGPLPTGDWQHKPSLCLPVDYGITTRDDGLWKCTITPPGNDDWKTDPSFDDSSWAAPYEYDSSYSAHFNTVTHESYWKHMIPGASPIWGTGNIGDDNIYCRYVIEATVPSGPPIPMPLDAPSDLVGVSDSDTQITISWNDNSWNESGFQVNRDGAYLTLLASNTTSYSDTGLSADTEYDYQVRAYNTEGDSAWSNVVTVRTNDTPAPVLATIFVTSNGTSADLVTAAQVLGYVGSQGLAAADFLCQNASEQPTSQVRPGTWKAWLSDSTTNARDRLTHNSTPYVLVSGNIVANNWGDLIDSTLMHDISETYYGGIIGGDVFTGTNANGAKHAFNPAGDYCENWTSDSIGNHNYVYGRAYVTSNLWTAVTSGFAPTCSNFKRLYCLWQE